MNSTSRARAGEEVKRHLEVPDEVRLGVVALKVVVEQLPVRLAFDSLPPLAQHHRLLVLLLLLTETRGDNKRSVRQSRSRRASFKSARRI